MIAFFNDITGFMHESRVVNVIYLEFHEVLDTASHSIFLCKLSNDAMDDGTVRRKMDWTNKFEGQ